MPKTPTTESPASDEKPAGNGISGSPDPSRDGSPEADGGWEDSDSVAARILTTELGGLRLGMKREDVQALARRAGQRQQHGRDPA